MVFIMHTGTQHYVAMNLHNLLIRAQDTVDFPSGGQNHISQALLKCMHVHCPSILTTFSTFFSIHRVMYDKMVKYHYAIYILHNTRHYTVDTSYH